MHAPTHTVGLSIFIINTTRHGRGGGVPPGRSAGPPRISPRSPSARGCSPVSSSPGCSWCPGWPDQRTLDMPRRPNNIRHGRSAAQLLLKKILHWQTRVESILADVLAHTTLTYTIPTKQKQYWNKKPCTRRDPHFCVPGSPEPEQREFCTPPRRAACCSPLPDPWPPSFPDRPSSPSVAPHRARKWNPHCTLCTLMALQAPWTIKSLVSLWTPPASSMGACFLSPLVLPQSPPSWRLLLLLLLLFCPLESTTWD